MISVLILTYNSEMFIKSVLESVKEFDDIVVVDSGSTDSTLSIVKKYTSNIYKQEWLGYAKQKQFGLQFCKYNYVLNLDSDEVASKELINELKAFAKNEAFSGVNIPIREHFMGSPFGRFTKKCYVLRFFDKRVSKYSDSLVHEGVEVAKGEIGSAKGFIEHYGIFSIATKVEKINKYSSLKVEQKAKRNPSLLRLIFIMPLVFFKSYILKLSFTDGVKGFVSSVIGAFYAFLQEAKYFERKIIMQKNAKYKTKNSKN